MNRKQQIAELADLSDTLTSMRLRLQKEEGINSIGELGFVTASSSEGPGQGGRRQNRQQRNQDTLQEFRQVQSRLSRIASAFEGTQT